MQHKIKILQCVLGGIFVLALDQVVKSFLISRLIHPNESYSFAGIVKFFLVYNKGIAFGVGEFLGVISIIVLLVLVFIVFIVLYWRYLRMASTLTQFAAGIIFGGAVSNFVDRIIHGAVIDYVSFNYFPSFNIADVGIVVGIGLILLQYLVIGDKHKAKSGGRL